MARKSRRSDLFSISTENIKLRRENWSERETLLLIAIWKETKQDLKKTKRNRIVYEHMSKVLNIYNVNRSSLEIRRKVKNLSVQYRKEKLQAETTGCPSSWRYYARIDKVLGNCPIIEPGKKLELLTIKKEPSDDENVLSNSESNDSDNGMLPLIAEVLAPNDKKYNQGKKRSHDEEDSAEESKESQNMLDIIESALEECQAPKNKKYNQRKKVSHDEDDSTEESTGTRNILDVIENALEECKVLREEHKEINIKLVEVIERQNQLLEKLLEKL
ncbi:msantd1 [Trichonephila clavata]|uniref:Msantd1 n=1 Tax=Trichonephila clavata TaxID=2740835 RepID=A0A8X6FI65_TRICU|nr:msantd1 [Trichonephila clavata]